jgi:hypothetical protein
MQKRRAIFSVTLSTVALVLVAVACDDESTSKFEEPGSDANFDTGPGFVDDAGNNEEAGPVECKPSLPSFTANWKAPTKASACSAQQLGEYYDACLTTQSPDAGSACKTWTDANAACRDCIEPTDNSGPIQWHRNRKYYTLNVGGCLAIERSEPTAGQCPEAYGTMLQCRRDACSGCFDDPNAVFADFQTCQQEANKGVCATYAATFGNVCPDNYNQQDGGAPDCFPTSSNEASKDHFVRVEGIFCGP